VTALGKLFRTTTFKLTLVYLTVFALFAAFLLGYFALNTRRLITEQITDTVNAEITGLSEQYRLGGIRRLVIVVDARARRPGSSLYLVTAFTGDALAGNVTALAPGILQNPGWTETVYRRLDEAESRNRPEHEALVRVFQLPGGFRLLVGRDLEERERLYRIVLAAGRWSVAIVIVLGLGGGLLVSRRVLRRVDAMTETTKTIMEGDLGERLPVAGTGDEIDRLAQNLNAMLERIEALMQGLKEVSDNIAHDLKTPLTRLRNRAEQALRVAGNEAEYRTALEATIEESDGLIRTFNALLMIARAESGQARDDMNEFDAAEIAHDIGELYEPLADEKGIALKVEAAAHMMAENIMSLNPKFQIEVRNVEWKDYLVQYRNFMYPIFIIGWGADYADPHNFMYTFMHSRGVYGRYMGYENAEVDRLCEAGIATVDPKEREKIYHRLQDLWYTEAIANTIYQQIVVRAYRDWVKGYVPNPMLTDANEMLMNIWKE
jgi:hypothetical protein